MQQYEVRIEALDIQELCVDVLSVYHDVAAEKNITLSNLIDMPVLLQADKNMLKTVLRNLINNAIKFSKDGGFVSISVEETDDKIVIQILDDGVGMSQEQLDQLFSIGQRKSTVGTSGEVGTGLGLNMCKDMMEAQMGEISVESEPERGSVFRLYLNRVD